MQVFRMIFVLPHMLRVTRKSLFQQGLSKIIDGKFFFLESYLQSKKILFQKRSDEKISLNKTVSHCPPLVHTCYKGFFHAPFISFLFSTIRTLVSSIHRVLKCCRFFYAFRKKTNKSKSSLKHCVGKLRCYYFHYSLFILLSCMLSKKPNDPYEDPSCH